MSVRSNGSRAQGSLDEDGDDLTALLEALDLAPAHIVTSSLGDNIALRLAARRPVVFRSLPCHEPALPRLLEDDVEGQQILRGLEAVGRRIAAGDHEGAARQFLDELRSPDPFGLDTDGLAGLDLPICLTGGTQSPPAYTRVVDRLEQLLPGARRELIEGAAHLPHVTTPDRYVEVVTRVLRQN